MCVPIIVIPKKTKNQGATFDKKSGIKWHPMTITITIGMKLLSFPVHTPVHSSHFLQDTITDCVGIFATTFSRHAKAQTSNTFRYNQKLLLRKQ